MSSLWGVGSLFPPLDSLAALFVLVEAGFGGALSPPVSGRAHVVPPHVGPRGNGKDDDNQREQLTTVWAVAGSRSPAVASEGQPIRARET